MEKRVIPILLDTFYTLLAILLCSFEGFDGTWDHSQEVRNNVIFVTF